MISDSITPQRKGYTSLTPPRVARMSADEDNLVATQQMLENIQHDMYGHCIAPITLSSSSSSSSASTSDADNDDATPVVDNMHVVEPGVDALPSIRPATSSLCSTSTKSTTTSSGSRVVCTPQDQLVVAATQLPTGLVFTPRASVVSSSSSSSAPQGRQRSPDVVPCGSAQPAVLHVQPAVEVLRPRKRVRVISPKSEKPSADHNQYAATSETQHWCPADLRLSQLNFDAAASSSSDTEEEDELAERSSVHPSSSTGAFYDVNPSSIRHYLALRESRGVPLEMLPFASLVSVRAVDALHRFDEALCAVSVAPPQSNL